MEWKNFSLVVFLVIVIVLTTLTEGKGRSRSRSKSRGGSIFNIFGSRSTSHSSGGGSHSTSHSNSGFSGSSGSSYSTSHSNSGFSGSYGSSYSTSHSNSGFSGSGGSSQTKSSSNGGSTSHSSGGGSHSTSHSNSGISGSSGSSYSTSHSNSGFSGSGGSSQIKSSSNGGGGSGWFSKIFGGSRPRRINYISTYSGNPYHSTTVYNRETADYNSASRGYNPPTVEYSTPTAEYNTTIAAETNSEYNGYLFGFSLASILRSDFYSLFSIISDASKYDDDKEIDTNKKILNITTVADATTEKANTTTDFNYGISNAQTNFAQVDADSTLAFENNLYDTSTPTTTEEYLQTTTAKARDDELLDNDLEWLGNFKHTYLTNVNKATDFNYGINNAQTNVEEVDVDSKQILEKIQYDNSTPTNIEDNLITTTSNAREFELLDMDLEWLYNFQHTNLGQ